MRKAVTAMSTAAGQTRFKTPSPAHTTRTPNLHRPPRAAKNTRWWGSPPPHRTCPLTTKDAPRPTNYDAQEATAHARTTATTNHINNAPEWVRRWPTKLPHLKPIPSRNRLMPLRHRHASSNMFCRPRTSTIAPSRTEKIASLNSPCTLTRTYSSPGAESVMTCSDGAAP